jgi:hypothetical protein
MFILPMSCDSENFEVNNTYLAVLVTPELLVGGSLAPGFKSPVPWFDVVRTWSQHMPGASIWKVFFLIIILSFLMCFFVFPGILRDVYWRSL